MTECLIACLVYWRSRVQFLAWPYASNSGFHYCYVEELGSAISLHALVYFDEYTGDESFSFFGSL